MPLLLISASVPQNNKDANIIQPHLPHHYKLGLYLPYPSVVWLWMHDQKWSIYIKLPGLKTEVVFATVQIYSEAMWDEVAPLWDKMPATIRKPLWLNIQGEAEETSFSSVSNWSNYTWPNARHSQIYTYTEHSCQSTAQQSLILYIRNEEKSYRIDGHANKSEVLPVKPLNKWTECFALNKRTGFWLLQETSISLAMESRTQTSSGAPGPHQSTLHCQ